MVTAELVAKQAQLVGHSKRGVGDETRFRPEFQIA
jgi:hypothetical protein